MKHIICTNLLFSSQSQDGGVIDTQTRDRATGWSLGMSSFFVHGTMVDTEFTVPTVLDGKLPEYGIPSVDRCNKDPENHQDLFGLAIVACMEVCPVKRRSYDSKDLCPAFSSEKQLP